MPEPNISKIELAAQLKAAGKLDAPTQSGEPPLVQAAMDGDLEFAKLLLENGAKTEGQGASAQTALAIAAEEGNLELFQLLLKHKANLNALDEAGHTVLMHAVVGGNPQIVQLILDHEPTPDLEAINESDLTALMLAHQSPNSFEMLDLLIKKGANLNAIDNQENNALSFALARWHSAGAGPDRLADVVLLLSNNATLSAADAKHYKPELLDYAMQCLAPDEEALAYPTLYKPDIGKALLARYIELYPNSKSTQKAKCALAAYAFKINPHDPNVLSTVLALDSSSNDVYTLKHAVINQYYQDKGYPLTPAAAASIKTIIDLSHTQPTLAKEAFDNIGSYFLALQRASAPAQPGVEIIEPIEAAEPELKVPAVSRAAALAQYTQDLQKAKQSIKDDASLYILKKYSVVYVKNIHPMDMKRGEIYLSKTGDQYIIANQVPGKPAHSGSLSDLSDLGKNVLNKKERAQLKKELNKWKKQKQPIESPVLNDLIIKIVSARQHIIPVPKTAASAISPQEAAPQKMSWWAKLFGRKPKTPPKALPSNAEHNSTLIALISDPKVEDFDILKNLRRMLANKELSISADAYKVYPERMTKLLREISEEPSISFVLIESADYYSVTPEPGQVYFQREPALPPLVLLRVKVLSYGSKEALLTLDVPEHLIQTPNNSPEFLSWLEGAVKQLAQEKNYVIHTDTMVQRAAQEIDNYYFTKANNYFTQAREPGIEADKRTELLEQALQHCLQLSSNNDYYQNFKEMVFNLYLSGEEANIMEPLSEVAAGALTDSEQHLDLSYAILQSQKHQHDALLERAHRAVQEKSPVPPVAPVASSAVTPVSINPPDAQPSDKLDADEPKPPRADI